MALCKFDKLLRCFLLLICIGAIFLTLNHHSIQKFSVEVGSHIMKGFLNPKQVFSFDIDSRNGEHGNYTSIAQYDIETMPLPSTISAGTTNDDIRIEKRGMYSVLNNYIPATLQPPYNASLTLCTQGTYDFLHHVSVLCTRWDGPLSVAVYAPGDDFPSAVNTINRLRQCGPPCVRLNVSWHLIYDTSYPPPNITAVPEGTFHCQDNVTLHSSFKKDRKLVYPINVARNVARTNAKTHYVLPSDIELYPSVRVVERFLKMVQPEKNDSHPRVYVLPVFEVTNDSKPPETKSELIQMMKSGKAVFFHKYVCDVCQRFPKRDEWLKALPPNDSLSIFHITKRDKQLSAWEPIYIGTKEEPIYDERLSWEGKKDKMSQMYELCLMDYDVYILDNAFLVHAPGIKSFRSAAVDHRRRGSYVVQNNKVFRKIISDLNKKYPKHNC